MVHARLLGRIVPSAQARDDLGGMHAEQLRKFCYTFYELLIALRKSLVEPLKRF
jgi:hypothetical protein